MNAILIFPSRLATELKQLRCEVARHSIEIEAATRAHEQSLTLWAANESDISRRLSSLRERLARVLA